MNQIPTKPKARALAKPIVLPKRCAPPKGLTIAFSITAILLVISVMILSVALLVGGNDASSHNENGYTPRKTTPKTEEKEPDLRPKIAITFDDGPHNVRTKEIVDELNKYGYHATFFVVGNRVDGTEYNGKEALQYAVKNGNEIGIHGYTHSTQRYYDVCSDADYQYEISSTQKAIAAVSPDTTVQLMRPVGGRITAARVAESPYSIIMWDIDSEDWKYKGRPSEEKAAENINQIVENVMSQVHEGGIILMHDLYENTFEATKIILQRLHEEGYNVVGVSELLGDTMEAGKSYSRRK